MRVITIRGLPEETHGALRLRAGENNRSTEAEVRAILEAVVRPKKRVNIDSELAAFARKYGGLELIILRDRTPIAGSNYRGGSIYLS